MDTSAKIEGGYFIIARKLWESNIAFKSPVYRETWLWLLSKANHKDINCRGTLIKRGQCLITYKDIVEGLSWMVGYRKEYYNEEHMKKVMKYLRKTGMIASRKTIRGVIVTICNYDYYQNPKNYERPHEGTSERTNVTPHEHQGDPPINKNDNNGKNGNEGNYILSEAYRLAGHLARGILKNNPAYKELRKDKIKQTIKRWAKDIDLMIRVDGREYDGILDVVKWCQQDSFWFKNILSGSKLRKQFDRLLIEQRSNGDGKSRNYSKTGSYRPKSESDKFAGVKREIM